MRTKPLLTIADVDRMVATARAEAAAIGAAVTICVVDDAGALLRLDRLDDAPPISLRVAQGKARTAVDMRMPTGEIEEMAAGFPSLTAIPDLFPFRGGVPLWLDGCCIGGVGVSGGAPDQDVRIARSAAATLT